MGAVGGLLGALRMASIAPGGCWGCDNSGFWAGRTSVAVIRARRGRRAGFLVEGWEVEDGPSGGIGTVGAAVSGPSLCGGEGDGNGIKERQ
jgi:hypothetical protein